MGLEPAIFGSKRVSRSERGFVDATIVVDSAPPAAWRRRPRAAKRSVDPLDVVPWPRVEHPADQLVGHRRRRCPRILDRRANLTEPTLHSGGRVHGDHPRGRWLLVAVGMARGARDENRFACRDRARVRSRRKRNASRRNREELILRQMPVRRRAASEPTMQSSANMEPPDSSPVTRNVYMSPGPQNDRPVCPDATWITRLVNSFIVDFSFVASRSRDRASRVPPARPARRRLT